MEAQLGSGKTKCSPEILKAIYGDRNTEAKADAYDQSLQNWWKEYAARKNDEEEEHVADSLLYDERCHLPRSAPKPVFKDDLKKAGAQNTQKGSTDSQ